jgi:hypothetical protein
MIVVATGFIPLFPLFIVFMVVVWDSTIDVGRSVLSTGQKNSRKACTGALAAAI